MFLQCKISAKKKMDYMNRLDRYPLGGFPTNRDEVLSKAVIACHIASIYKGVDARTSATKFLELYPYCTYTLPTLAQAVRRLGISIDCVTDAGKVEYWRHANITDIDLFEKALLDINSL